VTDIREAEPKFASVEDLYGSDTVGRAAPRIEGELRAMLAEFLDGLGCDRTAFDSELRRLGCAEADFDAPATWRRDGVYRALLSGLSAASRSYRFAPDRRPPAVPDFRAALRARARDLAGAPSTQAGVERAIRVLALTFDPVYWTEHEGSQLDTEELGRALATWESYVRRAARTERRRTPWLVELALDMSVHEFRRLASASGIQPLRRRDVLRAALCEVEPVFAIRALTVFLAANSPDLARALAAFDQ
jgi:hypothetical protein